METEDVWNEYRWGLKAYLSRRVSNPDDVDDLLQDILLKTHQSLSKLQDADTLRGWIFRIAHNATVDFYRKKGRASAISPDDLWYRDERDDAGKELQVCLAPLIDGLAPDEAELLRAVDLQGIAQKSHAEALGVSYSTLKSRVQTARRRLHKRFTDCCNFEFDPAGRIVDFQEKSGTCKKC